MNEAQIRVALIDHLQRQGAGCLPRFEMKAALVDRLAAAQTLEGDRDPGAERIEWQVAQTGAGVVAASAST